MLGFLTYRVLASLYVSRRSHKRIPSFSTVPRTLHFLMEFVQMLGFVLVGSKRTYGEKVLDTFKLKLMGINLIHVRKCPTSVVAM